MAWRLVYWATNLVERDSFLMLPLAILLEQSHPIWKTGIGRITGALIAAAQHIQVVVTSYTGLRYFTMEANNRAHGLHPWWSGEPLLEAISALPDLYFGRGDLSANPAQQYLLTDPNSVNLVCTDIWLYKATLFGVLTSALCGVAAAFLSLALLSARTLRAGLRPVRTVVNHW